MKTEFEMNLQSQILIDSYKIVSSEIHLYLKEKMKCFLYAAILIALYLGVGIGNEVAFLKKIRAYLPFGFVILITYFLQLQYLCMGLMQYRASLEKKINKLCGKPIINLDSKFTSEIQRYGYLQMGKRWWKKIPSPSIFLALIVVAILIVVFIDTELQSIHAVKFILLGLCGLLVIYVFFVFPKLVEKKIEMIDNSTEYSEIEGK